jgi:myosin heavy subunit
VIEHPHEGIMALINEECFMPKGNDFNITLKLDSIYKKNNYLSMLIICKTKSGITLVLIMIIKS